MVTTVRRYADVVEEIDGRDIVVVTADSVRYDFVDAMPFVSSMSVHEATTVAHYTRPSLAGTLSSSYVAAARSSIVDPSLAEVLADHGYTCLGFACSPQLDAAFGFDRGFHDYTKHGPKGQRGSGFRERLAEIEVLRRLYHRFYPPHAKIEDLPDDGTMVDTALDRFGEADPPRFLWLHLIDTHRPYGRGNGGISERLDRKAVFADRRLADTDHERIVAAYEDALGNTDRHIRRLYEGLPSQDPIFVVTSDHGDEMGEYGRYFHQPQRRRLPEALTQVPLAVDGLTIESPMVSLIDLAPSLAGANDIPIPGGWDGLDLGVDYRDHAVAIAPWGDRTTMKYTTADTAITCRDGTVGFGDDGGHDAGDVDVPDEVGSQLRELGYIE